MSTITTINGTDLITNSRAVINTNFANLNSDKVETSAIDTDTTLASNSDAKIPSQKAIKAYVDAGGNVNASTTAKGIVEIATQAEVDAGTATGGTGATLAVSPDTLSSAIGSKKSVTAGETINGATTPVPVYQDKSDFEFYACDANDTTKMKFLGFAVSNGTNGNSMTVQFTGIVSGFSGLTRGEKYYATDTAGAISTTAGTQEILVGIAISATEIMIQKGRRTKNGTHSFTTTGTQAVTLGFRPSAVRVFAQSTHSSGVIKNSQGGWNSSGGNYCVYIGDDGTPATTVGTSSSEAWRISSDVSPSFVGHAGTITTITDTGFTLSNTESGSASDIYLYWEAEGEI